MYGNYGEPIDFLNMSLVFEIIGWSVLNLPPCTVCPSEIDTGGFLRIFH